MSNLIARRGMMAKQGGGDFPAGYKRARGIRINAGAYAKYNKDGRYNKAGLKISFTKLFDETNYKISFGNVLGAIIYGVNNVLGYRMSLGASDTVYYFNENVEQHSIEINMDNDGAVYNDGVLQEKTMDASFRPLGIGAYLNSSYDPVNYSKGIIVHNVFYKDHKTGTNVEFVPAVRNSDNVAGFINIAEGDEYGLFLPSASDVPFVAVI